MEESGSVGQRSIRAGALASAALAGTMLLASAAGAEPPAASGFWWVRPLVGLPPVIVPEDGLWVSAVADQVIALTAIRGQVDGVPTVQLPIEHHVGGSVTLVACEIVSDWEPPGPTGGNLEDAPEYDCSERFAAGVEIEGTVRFDLAPLAIDGAFDVAIVPSPASEAVFSITFAKTDDDTVVVRPAPLGPTQPSTTTPTPPAGDVAPPVSSPSPSFEVPALPAVDMDAEISLPTRRVVDGGGEREPVALLLAAALVLVYAYRTRLARAAAPDHALATSPFHASRGGGPDVEVAP